MEPTPDLVAEAEAVLVADDLIAAAAAGKRVRVVRAVVFEGDADAVRRQILNSSPLGERVLSPRGMAGGEIQITVAQGPIQVLD